LFYKPEKRVFRKFVGFWVGRGQAALASRIVIEVEGLGTYATALRLIVDSHLVAENLTPEKTRRLIVEILDRIAVALEVEEAAQEPSGSEFCTVPFAPTSLH
jgi:hypothetical protein